MISIAALAAGLAVKADNAEAQTAPTIQSNLDDYPPGGLVTLTGSNWQPGETVNIYVNDDVGKTWERNVNVTADPSGNITDQFNLPDWFVAVYQVRATGAQSGVATTSFTDGDVRFAGSANAPATWKQNYFTYSSRDCTGTGTAQQLTMSGAAEQRLTLTGTQSLKLNGVDESSTQVTFDRWTRDDKDVTSPVTTADCLSGQGAEHRITTHFKAVQNQTISFVKPPDKTYGDAPFQVSATASSGLPVSMVAEGQCTLAAGSTSGTWTVNITGAGNCTLTATQAGNDAYNAALPVAHTFAIAKAGQTIAFNAGTPTTKTYGDAPFQVGATASSGLPVSYAAKAGSACTVSTSGLVSITGAGSCTIVASQQTGDANYFPAPNKEHTITVNPKVVTGSFTANDKVYDGNNSATVKSTALPGVLAGDVVNLVVTNAQFADKNVSTTAKTVRADLALSGADAGKYTLSSTVGTTTANITPKSLTGSFTANNKVYDGNTDATIATSNLDGRITGDVVTLSGDTATFDNRNVGTGKTVTVNRAALSGADAGNYMLAQGPWTTTADITAKELTGSFTAANKSYDGNTSATIATRSVGGEVSGDDVSLVGGTATFDNANVGTAKTVTATGFSLSGAAEGNYILRAGPWTTTADINRKELTGSFTAANKTYDGNTSATIATRSLQDVVGDEAVSLTGGTATFADKNVGQGKTVTATGFTLTGTDANNYTLKAGPWTATANITPKSLTGSFTANNKVYDGNTDATIAT
ncbi:MAG TPA: YDG domain-containing protein, partial [Pseudonocardiaceae bacterium]|nr:YDG domain-containing protein [Pseudonocardiaceae bacterium]